MKGKLIIFSAPSGSGKTTIVKNLLNRDLDLEFSISACTRKPRNEEVDGKDYYFHSPEDFRRKIENDEFVEWEEVYKDQYYGTLKSELDRIWNKNHHVVFDIDVIGGINLKKMYKERALAIFVKPPSVELLEKRLRSRKTENEASVKKRIEKAAYELTFSNQFDLTIINDKLEVAIDEAYKTVKAFTEND